MAYHSWEREINDNNYGLLRQYFPKGMELTEMTEEQVKWAVDILDHRPREVLGFKTPFEVSLLKVGAIYQATIKCCGSKLKPRFG